MTQITMEFPCTLEHLGYKVVQVDGIKDLVERLASGEHKEWDLVLSIAEGLHGLARFRVCSRPMAYHSRLWMLLQQHCV